MFENRRYLIIPTSILGDINFNEVGETSADTVRKSLDGTKTFVKYDVTVVDEDYDIEIINGETNETQIVTVISGVYGRPSFYLEEYQELTHTQVLELLNTSEWNDETNYMIK
jgi:hypothetical protein